MHYRLVAGVIELPPEIEMIAQEMQRVGWSTDQGRNYLKKHFGDILPTRSGLLASSGSLRKNPLR